MKKIYLVFYASLLSMAVSAKTTSLSSPSIYPHFTTQGIAPLPGSANIRIIGQTYFTFNGSAFEPFDSTTYSYSNGRGGLLTRDELEDKDVNFDESYTYVFDPSNGLYHNRIKRFQSFVGNKSQLYTIQKWSSTFWKDSSRYKYIYDQTGTLLDSTSFQLNYDGFWVAHVPYKNVYDGSNNVTQMRSIVLIMDFAYNTDNNIQELTTTTRDMISVQPYSFTPWEYEEHLEFNYDLSGKLDNYVVKKWDGGLWLNQAKFLYSYNGQDVATITELKWDHAVWVVQGMNSYTYDANHNKLTDTWQTWNAGSSSFVNSSRSSWVYNSADQPTLFTTDTWDAGSSSWMFTTDDFKIRYYYETYTPTGVYQVNTTQVDVQLYPVPANDQLTVNMNWTKAQPYTISVYDMQGKLVKHSEETPASHVQKSIPVNDLSSGSYFIRIAGQDGQRTEKFTVVH